MEQKFNKHGKRKFYWAIAILLLISGGTALAIFAYQLSFVMAAARPEPAMFRNALNTSVDEFPNSSANVTLFRQQEFRPRSVTEPLMLTTLFTSIISILGGVSLIMLLRSKDAKELKTEIVDTMVVPDEKTVIIELEKHSGQLTQAEIVRNTGLTKVKIHRIVKRLEALGIVKKYPYGLTNKIKLEKRLYEDA